MRSPRLASPVPPLALAAVTLAALPLTACDGGSEGPAAAQPEPANTASAQLDLPSPEAFAEDHEDFSDYWHQGLAELSRYRLSQARYGDTHEGEAVLIFVTEPFLPDEQVKDDDGNAEDAVQVLKLNHYRRFYTGIYPYTVLTSTFSPEQGGPALKASGSVQEWCGHAYTQLNRRDGRLQLTSHSYFEDEADREATLPEAPFEDGLMATIRRDPSALPSGEVRLVPGLHYLRFRHREVRPYRAEVSRGEVDDDRFGGRVARLRVRYPELERTLSVYYGRAFPRPILGWEEEGPEGRTEAVRTNAILTDYWSHHGAGDGAYREALGLTE